MNLCYQTNQCRSKSTKDHSLWGSNTPQCCSQLLKVASNCKRRGLLWSLHKYQQQRNNYSPQRYMSGKLTTASKKSCKKFLFGLICVLFYCSFFILSTGPAISACYALLYHPLCFIICHYVLFCMTLCCIWEIDLIDWLIDWYILLRWIQIRNISKKNDIPYSAYVDQHHWCHKTDTINKLPGDTYRATCNMAQPPPHSDRDPVITITLK